MGILDKFEKGVENVTSRAMSRFSDDVEPIEIASKLRETMDKLKDKLKTAAIVLAATSEGKVQLAAGVTPDTVGRIKAGELVNFVAQQVGGKGGGKPDMAMAGGNNAAALPQALQSVQGWVAAKLA